MVDGEGSRLISQSFSISVLGKGALGFYNTSAVLRLNSPYHDYLEAEPFLYPTGKEIWNHIPRCLVLWLPGVLSLPLSEAQA